MGPVGTRASRPVGRKFDPIDRFMTSRKRKAVAITTLIAAILVGGYSVLGVIMAGTLTGSVTAAVVYAVLVALSLVAAVLAVRTLRRLQRDKP